MGLLNFTGFEAGGIGEVLASGTTQSFDTAEARTGYYCGRCNPTGTDTGFFQLRGIGVNGIESGNLNFPTGYFQFYFKYLTKPASNNEEIFAALGTSGGAKLQIRINSSGNLSLYDANNNKIGSDGLTALASNTYYQIRIKVETGDPVAYELLIDGVSELSGTANLGAQNNGRAQFGKITNRNGNSVDFYYDDCVIYDDAFPTTDLRVKEIIPIANGSTMSWVDGTGTSDYTQVDEIPQDDNDYVQSPTTGNPNVALFDMQSMSAASITANSFTALKGYIRTRENTSVTSATLIRVKSGATNSDSSTLNGSTTVVAQMRLLTTDPDTGVAWTESGLNAVEIGAVENNAVATRCTTVYGMVLYEPGSAPVAMGNMFLVM